MLNMGFVKDVTRIIEATPSDRELVLFSATTNQDVMTIAWKYQNEPVEVRIEATKENRPQITQYVIETTREQKYENLLYLLDSDAYQRVMVFINTKDMTQRICKRLKDAGYPADCLHGDMRQSTRNEVMSKFRKGKFQILLATDVAARGIDVDDVEAVINSDLPNENEYYLHRIGRTGRAKRHGVAFTLLTYTESVRFDEILKYIMAKPIPLKFDDMGILVDENQTPFFENM
jgi:ATP-dependent RNA helicase DeaD